MGRLKLGHPFVLGLEFLLFRIKEVLEEDPGVFKVLALWIDLLSLHVPASELGWVLWIG